MADDDPSNADVTERPRNGDESSDSTADATGSETVDVTVTATERSDETADTVSTAGSEPTDRERAALRRAKTMAHVLDDAVRIPGTNVRFGLDPVLGIAPGSGDAVAAALSLYPILEAYRLDAPRSTIAKMLSLITVDFVIGSIPIAGTVIDAFWKANEWNVRSLERHVEGR